MFSGKYRSLLLASTMIGQGKTVHQAEIDATCELIDFYKFGVKSAMVCVLCAYVCVCVLCAYVCVLACVRVCVCCVCFSYDYNNELHTHTIPLTMHTSTHLYTHVQMNTVLLPQYTLTGTVQSPAKTSQSRGEKSTGLSWTRGESYSTL